MAFLLCALVPGSAQFGYKPHNQQRRGYADDVRDEILYVEMPCLGDKLAHLGENGKYADQSEAEEKRRALFFPYPVFSAEDGGHRPEEHCVHHFVDLDYAARCFGEDLGGEEKQYEH